MNVHTMLWYKRFFDTCEGPAVIICTEDIQKNVFFYVGKMILSYILD